MHISKAHAEAEARRLAAEFLAANVPTDWNLDWEEFWVTPATTAPGWMHRKTIIKWVATVRWIPKVGGTVDGGPAVLVDIQTGQAAWDPDAD